MWTAKTPWKIRNRRPRSLSRRREFFPRQTHKRHKRRSLSRRRGRWVEEEETVTTRGDGRIVKTTIKRRKRPVPKDESRPVAVPSPAPVHELFGFLPIERQQRLKAIEAAVERGEFTAAEYYQWMGDAFHLEQDVRSRGWDGTVFDFLPASTRAELERIEGQVDAGAAPARDYYQAVQRAFRPLAEARGLTEAPSGLLFGSNPRGRGAQ